MPTLHADAFQDARAEITALDSRISFIGRPDVSDSRASSFAFRSNSESLGITRRRRSARSRILALSRGSAIAAAIATMKYFADEGMVPEWSERSSMN